MSVANPRRLRVIYRNGRKSDELDTRMLAGPGRVDPSLLRPVEHGGDVAQGLRGDAKAVDQRSPVAPDP